ncbi:MAG: hypothetical protein IT419_16295 [Planctomycetes bacterium]|nr:hypothetical protein [Planctomycetota bacterium]
MPADHAGPTASIPSQRQIPDRNGGHKGNWSNAGCFLLYVHVHSGFAAIHALWMANCEKTMSIQTLLLCVAVAIVAGGMQCQPALCPADKPVINPLTGLCEPAGGDDTIVPGGRTFSPGPGTGGLRTEPDTDTSMGEDADPDAVDLLIFGLNGRWLEQDNGRTSCIVHFASEMTSTLIEQRVCEHLDGTNTISHTFADLEGVVNGDTITGRTIVCRYGNSDPALNGTDFSPMMLTISPDGKTLSGTYIVDTEVLEFSLQRQTVGHCQGGDELLQERIDAGMVRVRIPESFSTELGHGGGGR